MEASHSLGTLHRILRNLWAVLTKPVPMRPVPRSAVRRSVPAEPLTRPRRVEPSFAPAVMSSPVVVPRQAVQEVAPPPVSPEAQETASAKPMRTLEEVRADLARLRERSRERQAQAPSRDTDFAPTDFMDFAQPATPLPRREGPDSNFAPTDFMDFVQPAPKSPKREAPDSNFAAAAFLDFTSFKVRVA